MNACDVKTRHGRAPGKERFQKQVKKHLATTRSRGRLWKCTCKKALEGTKNQRVSLADAGTKLQELQEICEAHARFEKVLTGVDKELSQLDVALG